MKAIVKKMKRQAINWEETLANHVFDKDLVPTLYKELPKLGNKKSNNPVKNGQNI